MSIRSTLIKFGSPLYQRIHWLQSALELADSNVDRLRHSIARVVPQVIRPDPRSLFISLTANCNYRCRGCNYGRDFMPGHQLPLSVVKDLLDDAKEIGFSRVRFYGGEPLLHRELPEIIEYATQLGLNYWLTTNGLLLKKQIDNLYAAGLRELTIGFYGTGESYNDYVQRKNVYSLIEEGVAYARDRFGNDLRISLDWVLMKPTATDESIDSLWKFAETYRTPIHVNLIHYSLPYFVTEESNELRFQIQDRQLVEGAVDKLLGLRKTDPELLPQTLIGLRSIPDWLIKGPEMRIPCERYRLIWVGPNGAVQMCYVAFELGNLHEKRLKEMMFTDTHRDAARSAFKLDCPNCNCGYDKRVLAHGPSRKHYSVDTRRKNDSGLDPLPAIPLSLD